MNQRPIKFRAWDKLNKSWVYVDLIGQRFVYSELTPPGTQAGDLEPWQQFTGLHDKNGKEIWEGDILSTNEGNLEVVFRQGSFRVKLRAGLVLLGWSPYSKVIGNIYENPDLLTQEPQKE